MRESTEFQLSYTRWETATVAGQLQRSEEKLLVALENLHSGRNVDDPAGRVFIEGGYSLVKPSKGRVFLDRAIEAIQDSLAGRFLVGDHLTIYSMWGLKAAFEVGAQLSSQHREEGVSSDLHLTLVEVMRRQPVADVAAEPAGLRPLVAAYLVAREQYNNTPVEIRGWEQRPMSQGRPLPRGMIYEDHHGW